MQLLALHLEMLGYILGLLKGFKYLRKTVDLIGDNLTLRLLRRTLVLDAPCKSTEDAENKLRNPGPGPNGAKGQGSPRG